MTLDEGAGIPTTETTNLPDTAPTKEPRRARGGRLAPALGLALLAALAAPPVLAQTTVTLVSNTDQTLATSGSNNFLAVSFDTGSNTLGYTLTSIGIHSTATAGDLHQ